MYPPRRVPSLAPWASGVAPGLTRTARARPRATSLRFMKRKPDGGLFRKRPFLPKERAKSPPRFKHIGRGLLSAGRAASCLDGDCATRDAALMAHQMRGARLHGWIVVDMPTVLPGVGHRLGAKTSFIIPRRASLHSGVKGLDCCDGSACVAGCGSGSNAAELNPSSLSAGSWRVVE